LVKAHLAEGKPWEGWIEEFLEFDSTYTSDLGCTEVYQHFEAHFRTLGYRRVMSDATFGRALKEVYPRVKKTRPRANGQREYRYSGLGHEFDLDVALGRELESVVQSYLGRQSGYK